jgi:hypothetical protein
MSFQWVFDNAEQLSINNLNTVGSTTARDGTYRAVIRNASTPKIFTVKLPDGPRWSDIRTNIAAIEALDRHTGETGIEIKYSLFPWYYGDVDPGTNDSYNLICVQFPQWNIFARDQVSWNGAFVFVEDIV